MRLHKNILLSGIAAATLFMAACGGGGSGPTPPPAISVTLSPTPPTSIVISKTASLTAVIANDSAAAGVTWKVTCGSTDCGSFNPASTPGNSATTTYTAPAAIPTGNTVVVVATSITDPTKSASATITVTGTPVISVSITNPPANLVVSTPVNLAAVVSEDPAAAGVTWSVTCGSAACGAFNPTTSPGNNPTTSYRAPAAIPTGNTVTVMATSVTDNTKSATATITIVAAPPPVLADGTYIYHVTGENGSDGPYSVAGAFTVQNAVITGGEQDFVDFNGDGGTNALVPTTSSLTLESSGNIQIVLDSGVNGAGVNGVVTLRGAMVSASRALISEFDASAAGTGSLDLQTGKAAPAGGYAFNLFGADGAAQASLLVIGGVLDITGTTIATNNSVFDYSDGGTLGQGAQFSSGAVSAPDQFGRITINLTPTAASGAPPFGLIGYIVGTNRIELVENNTDALQGSLGGSALGQGAKTNAFTTADVTGASYAFIANGADGNGLATFAGAFALNSNGSVSGVVAYNDTDNRQGLQITGGTWTVDPTGRVTLSNIMLSNANIGDGPYNFQLYVDGDGNAFELGNDAIQESTGPSFVQAGSLAPGQFAIAAQGFAATSNQEVWGAVGPVTIDASFNWNGFTDYNVFTGTPLTNLPLTGTTNSVSGEFELTGLSALANPLGPGEFGYYPISATKVLAIELDDNQPGNGVQLGVFVIEGVTQ
jgi:hypothetical protein